MFFFVVAIIVWFQWDQNKRSPIRDFKVYDPPRLLNDYVIGESFADIDRTDPLSVFSGFYLMESADQLLSLYTEEELDRDINREVLLSGKAWNNTNRISATKRARLLFSFKYTGRYGPPEWYMCYQYQKPVKKHKIRSVVFKEGKWHLWVSLNASKAREYIYENIFSDIYGNESLVKNEIEKYKNRLKSVDYILDKGIEKEKLAGSQRLVMGPSYTKKSPRKRKERVLEF